MEVTCINCPVGCRMTVTLEGGCVTKVEGNACRRGEAYAHQECVAPLRMVTAVVPIEGSAAPLPVKTRTPIPRERIDDCMRALSLLPLSAPIQAGTVVLSDVCGTGVDVVATSTRERDPA